MTGSRQQRNAARAFCGRDHELRLLQAAYRPVATGEPPGPRLVALVAESGLGKTRLVQEFFRWLSTHEDAAEPEGYWPDALTTFDNNLQLNPDPAACNNSRPVPFLWWGLRLADPGARNQAIAGQLASSIDTLTPHLEPIYRTRRRKDTLKGIGISLGKATVDVIADLIPGAGLFKTLGETAWEMSQHVRGVLEDGPLASPGHLRAQQHEDLASRIVSDLGLLLSRESRDVSSVPAVIIIDDGQFSTDDPSIVTFLDRMLAASIEHRWRMLFIVTYWTAEWNRHLAGQTKERTIAQVIRAYQDAIDPGWAPTFLSPVADLSPIVAAALPGLEPPQAAALLERAGGNPRYLDEILRFCERNPRLFVGRSLDGPLTPQGFDTLMEKTVDLHELVEERLQDLAPEVRRAVVLASVQGQEFVEPLVSDLGELLHEQADDAALEAAEHPHAFIHRQPGRLGAFTQRIFHEVAVAQVPNEFEEEEVDEALRAAVRRRLDDGERLMQEDVAARTRTCLLGVQLFVESDDDTDRVRAAYALAVLTHEFWRLHDYELSNRYGSRLAGLLSTIDSELPHYYLYFVAAESLENQGRFVEGCDLLKVVIPRERRRAERDPDVPERLALLLRSAGHCARKAGDLPAAEEFLREALEIDRREAVAGRTPWAARNLMVSLLSVGRMAEIRGALDVAERDFGEAHDIARQLRDRDDNEQTRDDLCVALVAVGDVARVKGDAGRAEQLYREVLSLEGTGDFASDPERAAARATSLERLGSLMLERGSLDEAERLLTEALALRRTAAERLPSPEMRINLSNVLQRVGDLAQQREDWQQAQAAYAESLEVITQVAGEIRSPKAYRVMSLALERLGKFAILFDDNEQAEAIFRHRLELDRWVADSQRTPAEWRNVMSSLYWLADIAEVRGDLDQAERFFLEALGIARDIAGHVPSADTRDDLRRVLRRLAKLAHKQGKPEVADQYEAET